MTTEKPEADGYSFERVSMSLEKDIVAFVDEQAAKLQRSRSWMFATLARRYKQKLDREAERREKARQKRRERLAG